MVHLMVMFSAKILTLNVTVILSAGKLANMLFGSFAVVPEGPCQFEPKSLSNIFGQTQHEFGNGSFGVL